MPWRPARFRRTTRRLAQGRRHLADLLWVVTNLVGVWVLAALPAAIVAVGLVEFIGPNLVRTIAPPAFSGNSAGTLFVLGGAIIATGVATAPWLLRGYGLLAGSMLTPAFEPDLALRVRELSQTRAEVLDTSAAEIRRIERDLHNGAQARLSRTELARHHAELARHKLARHHARSAPRR